MFESASTHTMIAVRDLARAKEFYGGTLGLKPFDGRSGAAVRYESHGDTWFMANVSARLAPRQRA
jgi:catechol 2,3-dioxygenase-like lactoylglutathione lyase family enzyme